MKLSYAASVTAGVIAALATFPASATSQDRIFASWFQGNATCIAPPGTFRQTSGTVTYPAGGGFASRDFTSFAALWGHATAYDPQQSWPGTHAASPIPTINRTGYIAAQFTVPNTASPSANGFIQRTTYSYGISMTAAYSVRCGDLNPPNPVCMTVTTGTPMAFPFWQTADVNNLCVLVPGQTYYLNIAPTNPAEASSTCPANHSTCPMATTNYFND